MARECFFEEICKANLNDTQEPVMRKEYRVFYKERTARAKDGGGHKSGELEEPKSQVWQQHRKMGNGLGMFGNLNKDGCPLLRI